jgi:predicted DNA-binding transcriptional regulator AlpA
VLIASLSIAMADELPMLLKPAELAKMLNCTVASIRNRVTKGEIPGVVRLHARGVRFRRDIIEKWIAQSMCTDLSESGKVIETATG